MHPATRILLCAFYLITVCLHLFPINLAIALVGSIVAITAPRKQDLDPQTAFMRIYLTGMILLFLINGIDYSITEIDPDGIIKFSLLSARVLALFSIMLWLARSMEKEEVFALFLSLRVPIIVIFVLMRTFWFIPRIFARSQDIILAQQMRGYKIGNLFERIAILSVSFNALFNSFLTEIEENSISLGSKGIFTSGIKSSFLDLKWEIQDFIYITLGFTASIYSYLFYFGV